MSKALNKKIRDGEVILCTVCLNFVKNVPGFWLSACRQGIVHDFMPINTAPVKPYPAMVSDLCQAPDILSRYIGLKAMPEILLSQKFKS